MTELDLINLARSATQNEVTWFGELVTINFAMVVGVYYFLGRARLPLRLFAFAAYLTGMLLYLGEMLVESSLKLAAIHALEAVLHLSDVAQVYIGVNASWLGYVTSFLFNGAFWLLAGGVVFLLFFWKGEHTTGGKV